MGVIFGIPVGFEKADAAAGRSPDGWTSGVASPQPLMISPVQGSLRFSCTALVPQSDGIFVTGPRFLGT
jgi:hypothetical protein